MRKWVNIALGVSLFGNILLLAIIITATPPQILDLETPALEEKNRKLLIRVENLKAINDSLLSIPPLIEIKYKDRIQRIYEIHDTNLLDSVRTALAKYEMPTIE